MCTSSTTDNFFRMDILRKLVFWVFMTLLTSSCHQPSTITTSRKVHHGKVTYTNHHRNTLTLTGLLKNHVVKTSHTANHPGSVSETLKEQNPSSERIAPLKPRQDELLLASVSARPVLLNQPVLILPKPENATPRRISGKTPGYGRTGFDTTAHRKNGEPGQADATHTTKRKTEKLSLAGFILSCIGLIPIIGIPFAVVGFVLSFIGFHRTRKNPARYKQRWLGLAGIIVGGIALLGLIVMIIVAYGGVTNANG